MQTAPLADNSFMQQSQHIEQALDAVVDHGNDDELFIASYLQGHFAVISKPLEMDEQASLAKLNDAVTASLADAFANNELEADDQQKVHALWQRLVEQAA
ncbi:YfcL family protein [Salinimonas lutimaris]|uniref:YfcL family protein n=1 Tax=Salinimonas lutimaris TaxID=914153 RepID=UPI0010C11B68|nr:YfcL family protein [Salinimonas lutimaris]